MGNFWYSDSVRVLFVADGRSPIAQNWIRFFAETGTETYLASTFACSPEFRLDGLELIPVAFSGAGRANRPGGGASGLTLGLRSAIRHWLGPLTIGRASPRLRRLIRDLKPDLVHALRIPYEGMLAADAYNGTPLVVSVWGNDFTLHAPSTPWMRHYTSWTMQVADGLHADCQRDIRLGKQWGFGPLRPTLISPGNGGIRTGIFHPAGTPVEKPVVLNPRGFRTYVRNDVFFQAIPRILTRRPDAKFLCAAMNGEAEALRWIHRLKIEQSVELLPSMRHEEMGDTFRRAQVVVSPSIHDGTPNTLLEGMACGCFPVAGDLESIREWIEPGRNGLLMDPTDADSVAEAILQALEKKSLREQAAGINHKIILERAEYGQCMAAARRFYERIISGR
ncbi:MAG TPA: glycosyltransferase [Anaerolineales bacterium]